MDVCPHMYGKMLICIGISGSCRIVALIFPCIFLTLQKLFLEDPLFPGVL